MNLHQGNMLVCFHNHCDNHSDGCWWLYHVFNVWFCLKDEEGVRYVPVRPRPPVTLLRHYRNPWKAAYHHFQRYSDIRVKGKNHLRANACIVLKVLAF